MAENQPSLLNVAKLGKLGVEYLAPETYSSLVPSWSSLLGGSEAAPVAFMDSAAFGGGSAAGGMSALGGLGMAGMYAAPAMLFALLGSMYGDTGDTGVQEGVGRGSLDGGYQAMGGPRSEEAAGLFDQYKGDGSWHQGGDTSLAKPLTSAVGQMSIQEDQPFWSIGGAPYESADLATASGRQISRGQMGMPVEYEQLYNMYAPGGQAPGISDMILNRSLPVYDAPAEMPSNWDSMIDMRNQFGTGEGQNSSDVRYDAWYGGLNPRQREWADMGLKAGQLYRFTGAESSPDAQPIAKNESPMPGALTPAPVVDPVQASLDANAKATAALPQKFTPEQMKSWLTYGMGPEALLGRPLDLASIIGS